MTKDTQQNAFWWGKKHSALPHAFLPHPYAFCFVLFALILVQYTRMMAKTPQQNAFGCGKKAFGFASCFFASSSCILLRDFCHHPCGMHLDDDKKEKAKCIRMRQKSIQLHLMLFCLILMHFALYFLSSSLCILGILNAAALGPLFSILEKSL